MALVNRDKDVSEQKDYLSYSSNSGNAGGLGNTALVTGMTRMISIVPYPCTIAGMAVAAQGVSTAMQVAFSRQYITSGGATVVGIGISNLVLVNYASIGMYGYSGLAAAGSTLLNCNAGDMILLTTSVANSACSDLLLSIIVKKTQEIVSYVGVST